MNIIGSFKRLPPLEHIVVLFYSAIILLMLFVNTAVQGWAIFILVDILLIAGMFKIAGEDFRNRSLLTKFVAYWYAAPLILLTFKQIYFLIRPLRGSLDYDHLLIAADKALLGVNPTEILFKIANPVLTEVLQISYAMFYILPIILGLALYRKKQLLECNYVIFITVYGFFISYIGYFLLPAVGPRFTLHDFAMNDIEMPGLFLTQFFRYIVNTGESIPPGIENPILHVQRDVFPSGHTMMTVMIMYLAVYYKSAAKYFLIPVGTLLIFATVYLRYHYVSDVLAGILFAVFALWSGRKYFNLVNKIRLRKENSHE